MSDKLNELLEVKAGDGGHRIVAQTVYDLNFQAPANSSIPTKTTIGSSKSLKEFYSLVNKGLIDYQKRSGISLRNFINLTEEDPNPQDDTEVISLRLVRREPGAYSQGAPFEGPIKNMRPMFRASGNDPDDPNYRFSIQGYWYDNLIRFTCWARTNKQANERANWFEDFMEEYTWWLRVQGVSRVLFWGRGEDDTVSEDANKWYGRPLDYFVRTEKLRRFEEKKLEEILIQLDANKT